MTTWQFISAAETAPFSSALGIVLILFIIELISLVLGGSIFGLGDDTFELDTGSHPPDFDIDPDLETGLDGEMDTTAATSTSGFLGALGLGRTPFVVWLTALLIGFGLGGYVLQQALLSLSGAMLPAALASFVALPAGLASARFLSGAIATMLPQIQTSAVSERHLGGRIGVITVGTALQGQPAEARVADHHGNTHYIRVEPRDADQRLSQGSEIVVLRRLARDSRIYMAVQLED